MPTYESFEELPVWQNAREFVAEVYKSTRKTPFARDFGLRDQLQRAAVSVMNNIAEGFERRGQKEFVQFLSYAKASAGECRSMIYVASDLGYIEDSAYNSLHDKSLALSKSLAGFVNYLRRA